MILDTVVVGALEVNCYMVGCEETRRAAVIDPGDNAPAILQMLERHRLELETILVTHAHFDHILAARSIQDTTGARFYVHPADRPLVTAMRKSALSWIGTDPGELPRVDGDLEPGTTLTVGTVSLEVRPTPGHSPGGVSFVAAAGRRVFSGDALFAGSIGRTDLPGGDLKTLLEGIRAQILSLPDDFAVLPGHGPATTVGQERRANPFLAPHGFDAWS